MYGGGDMSAMGGRRGGREGVEWGDGRGGGREGRERRRVRTDQCGKRDVEK